MPFEVVAVTKGPVLEVHISGRLTNDVYQELASFTETVIQKHGTVRILFIMRNFKGWQGDAFWKDNDFDLKHFANIERVAVVRDLDWNYAVTVFCHPFRSAEVKFFSHEDLEHAVDWIKN